MDRIPDIGLADGYIKWLGVTYGAAPRRTDRAREKSDGFPPYSPVYGTREEWEAQRSFYGASAL